MKAWGLVVVVLLAAGCTTAQPTPKLTTPATAGTRPSPTIALSETPTGPATSSSAIEPPPTSPPSTIGQLLILPFATGFGQLTFVTNAGDGSGDLYAVVKVGRILKVTKGQSVPGSPWLDISAQIVAGGEQGLLGLAFHPDFESNGRFFVDYTDVNGNDVVSEFTGAALGTADPSSERVLLSVPDPFPNHNGGMLAFGPDGYLYIGMGDGGSGGDPLGSGQSLTTDLGKILRIDVDSGDPFGIPTDNPFQPGNALGALPEVWDWGMRNPWRFSFDPESGGLLIGDVGQNLTEEIDVERAGLGGRNYGWNIMEGDHCYQASTCDETGLTLPVATYEHKPACSVTGGYVYRGALNPSLVGQYFYSDYCSGTIWSFDATTALAGQPVTPTTVGQVDFPVASFGEDEAGELYMVDLNGSIYSLGAAS